MRTIQNQRGVTLIELVIALGIAGILFAAVYSVFEAQTRGQVAQQSQLQMEQECRAALALMVQEIRSAGSNSLDITSPPVAASEVPGIVLATATRFEFTRDVTGGESDGKDNDHDGVVDNAEEASYPNRSIDDAGEDIGYTLLNGSLCRQTCRHQPPAENPPKPVCNGWQPLATNVDALNFVYLDQWGNVIPSPVGGAALGTIRQVQITIVARSAQKVPGFITAYKDTTTYKNQQGKPVFGPANDSFRRIRVTTTVTCRNMGLQAIPPG